MGIWTQDLQLIGADDKKFFVTLLHYPVCTEVKNVMCKTLISFFTGKIFVQS